MDKAEIQGGAHPHTEFRVSTYLPLAARENQEG